MDPAFNHFKKVPQKPANLAVPPGTTIRYYGWVRKCVLGNRHNRRFHRGIITCASRIHNGRLWIGLAWCSPKDQFSRKVGRTLAIERLYDDPCIIPFLNPRHAQIDFIVALCKGRVPPNSDIYIVAPLQLSKVPSWSRKMSWYSPAFEAPF